ncbi:DUF4232 domain-containing protein [Streptacidiphilus cavernicola]|uniref:DUF4232 domain-containing protein n=1 Tax=Streptacidiphilus cavernicola TaxID=3342716 RepID=A0ABV6W0D7_9ACTN
MRSSIRTVGALACAAAAVGFAPAAAVAAAPLSAASTPMCATSQLTPSLGGGDAGAGNLYRYLVLTNHSHTTCHVTGFPGLSMLDAHGKQIGAPATEQHIGYAPVVLAPGKSASDTIHTANRQTNSSTECLPTSTDLRIYPPGNKASIVFAGKVTNCDKLFSVTPFTAGTGGNPSNTAPSKPTSAPSSAPTGSQVSTVPSGAPDTGLALTARSGSDSGDVVGATVGGVLLVGGLGGLVLWSRNRSRSSARTRG